MLRSHLDLFLVPLAFVYKLFDSFTFYIASHSAVLAACAAVVYQYSNEILKNRSLALACALMFLLNPFTMSINLYTHFKVFGMLSLLLFAYCLRKGFHKNALICLAISLAMKQDFFVYTIMISLILADRKKWRFSAACVGISVFYYFFVIAWAWPRFVTDQLFFRQSIWNYGSSTTEIALYFLLNPITVLAKCFVGSGLQFQIMFLMIPVLAGHRYLLALAPLILWTNATEINRASLAYYYSYSAMVCFFIVLPFGWLNLRKLLRLASKYVMVGEDLRFKLKATHYNVVLLPLSFMIMIYSIRSHFYIPETLQRSPQLKTIYDLKMSERHHQIHQVMKSLSDYASSSVMTQFYLATYVPKKHDLKLIWKDSSKVFDQNDPPQIVVIDGLYQGFFKNVSSAIVKLDQSKDYDKVYKQNHFYVWKYRPKDKEITRS